MPICPGASVSPPWNVIGLPATKKVVVTKTLRQSPRDDIITAMSLS